MQWVRAPHLGSHSGAITRSHRQVAVDGSAAQCNAAGAPVDRGPNLFPHRRRTTARRLCGFVQPRPGEASEAAWLTVTRSRWRFAKPLSLSVTGGDACQKGCGGWIAYPPAQLFPQDVPLDLEPDGQEKGVMKPSLIRWRTDQRSTPRTTTSSRNSTTGPRRRSDRWSSLGGATAY